MNKGLGPKINALRQEGKSYNHIVKALGCSKGTVAFHCSKLDSNQAIKETLRQQVDAKKRRWAPIPLEKHSLVTWLLSHGVRRIDVADALDLDYQAVLAEPFHRPTLHGYARVRRRRLHLKMLAVATKGGRCERCGYSRTLSALEFHHLEASEKDFTLSRNANRSWAHIKAEIVKCELLCSNCHREEHDSRSNLPIPAL